MFKNNKYTKWYNSIISNALNQKRTRKDQYYESHHILPKSLGGSNNVDNLVLLTAKEHYICHLLLPKMTEGKNRSKMIYANWCLSNGFSNSKQRYTSKNYENARKAFKQQRQSDTIGTNNHFFGRTHTEETKNKFRGENNPAKRPEVRAKMRGPRPGQIRGPHSEQRKSNISAAMIGVKLSEERKLNMSRSKQNLVWIHKSGEKPQQIQNSIIPTGWMRGRGPRLNW